jgi:hypothetical protein
VPAPEGNSNSEAGFEALKMLQEVEYSTKSSEYCGGKKIYRYCPIESAADE